ncbi:MAG: DUF3987 domain-containing protein [Prevotella sp.]|nr:DUF3987 domain-containing protein [Prevotella sp.]
MRFDVYFAQQTRDGLKPGTIPEPMEWSDIKKQILENENWAKQIDEYRAGGCQNTELKTSLPSINYVGRSIRGRAKDAMIPTQLFMIDIDHVPVEECRAAWDTMTMKVDYDWIVDNVILAHISPSGGIHIIFKSQGYETIEENMAAVDEIFNFNEYGDYDTAVKDFSRVSFAFKADEILFESARLLMDTEQDFGTSLVNHDFKENDDESGDQSTKTKAKTKTARTISANVPTLSEEEIKKYEQMEFRGTPLINIVNRWVEKRGTPDEGEVHNYYNEMIKYFRNITSNNKKWLFAILPKFGHSDEECWSQIVSITKANTLSRIDREFFFFLKDNGFYVAKESEANALKEYMMSDVVKDDMGMPTLPPVFREFVKSAPKDFHLSVINALMAILGFLSTYVKAKYPYDDRWHTCSFFSIIYAPAGTGKGFVERLLDKLMDYVTLRDAVQSMRENIYLRIISKKGANDKAPDLPHTSLRVIPSKNSEAEFLTKQQDNHGAHMFTYAAEMDEWAKGEKAAGGNKSDMIRVAWDNGEYGQQFKSANTFRGKVRLYWNVLITGTMAQVNNYFKNVENGLVTRCCYTTIENQEFQLATIWKPIPAKGLETIHKYCKRCDDNTYMSPCTVDLDEAQMLSDDEFDKQVDWHFQFREKQEVDMSWIMPTIEKFQKEQCDHAALAYDKARDTFRRRVGVRGFRLALLCTTLYQTVGARERKIICNFVDWWMHQDIECTLQLWGKKYNDVVDNANQANISQRNVFKQLKDEFTKDDLYVVCKREGIKTKLDQILWQWKNGKHIEVIVKNKRYRKIQKDEK